MKKINWEKVTNFIKRRNFIMALCVFGLTMASISFSYASFFTVKTNTVNQSVTTGTLQVSYGNDTTSLGNVSSMEVLPDDIAMDTSPASVIYIQNTGSLDSTYVLNIGYDMDNFKNRTGYQDTDVLIPLDYVKFAVYEYNGVNSEDTLLVGPLTISELPIYYLDESDSNNNRYSILFSTLGGTSSTNPTKTYKIKTWVSDKAIQAVSYTYFYINTQVVAEVENAKMKYTLGGTITDGTNNLTGALISVQNGSVVSTSADGAFSLDGLYPGVYNLDITYDDIVYKGNITIEEGTSNSLSSLGTTFTGSNIFTVAKNYGTTINKILNKNDISYYSTAATISSGALYPTYKFVGGADEQVTGLKIVLDETNKTFTISL